MKIIALIFVGPVVLPIVVIFNHYIFYEKIAVALEDFTYIERYDGLRELDSLNNITIFAAFTTFYVLVSVFVFVFSSIRNDSLKSVSSNIPINVWTKDRTFYKIFRMNWVFQSIYLTGEIKLLYNIGKRNLEHPLELEGILYNEEQIITLE